MGAEKLYLRQDIAAQPVVDHWYAWSHLIPPATAALNITARHMKIMESYIHAPKVHAASVKNPALLGGPFMDYDGDRVAEIKELRDKTRAERASLIALAYAFKELDDLLRSEVTGHSLETLYPKVPEVLRGYVELVYDLNNHPSFRVVEPLLYESSFYDSTAQGLMLSQVSDDNRPFILSTPILPSAEALHVRRSFAHESIDMLFRMKSVPQEPDAVSEALGLDSTTDKLWRSFLTEAPPRKRERFDGRLRWRYLGHASVLIEASGLSVLVDPILSYGYENAIERYSFADLPDMVDCILITHGHQDHLTLETLLQLRHKTRLIVVPRNGGGALQDPSLKLMLRKIGFKNVIEIEDLEEIDFDGITITGLPFWGEHADLNITSKMAYLLRSDGWTALFAADSRNVEPKLYEHIHRIVGDLDVLFLGMECDGAPMTWLYGPLLTAPLSRSMDQSRRLSGSDFERALALVKCFNFKEVYVYAMGQEPWLTYISSKRYTESSIPIVAARKLVETCRANNIWAEQLYGMKNCELPSIPVVSF